MPWFQRSQIPNLSASTANLRQICQLRCVLLLCELTGLLIASSLLQYPLPVTELLVITVFYAVFVGFTLWRSEVLPAPVTQQELHWQLILDIFGQSLLLYFTGGYTNPLVSVYLVIITTGAALLPKRRSWLLTTIAIMAYTLLMNWYQPLGKAESPEFHDSQQQMISLHLLGMWFTFVVSALLINSFVVVMAQALRKQTEATARNRERQLRDETIIAVAIQAAGTAHELGTPLSTMAVILGDLQQEHSQKTPLSKDLTLLRTLIDECKKKLNQLVQNSHYNGTEIMSVSRFLDNTLEQWQLLRPDAPVIYPPPGGSPLPLIRCDLSLTQAVIALLDNAAKSCKKQITLSVFHNAEKATIRIDDRGEGISEAITQQAGSVIFNSPGHDSMGLGLLLSCASIERLGGQVMLYNRTGGGVRTEIILPALT